MSIGLSDELTPLGTFPLLDDNHLKGGYQTVADVTARDAIDPLNRKVGMLVYTTATAELWVLYPGITNGSWSLYTGIASALHETSGPTNLTIGTLTDGEFLKRVGSTVVSATPSSVSVTNSAPANVTKATAAVGVATDAARSDHKHDVTTAAPTTGIGAANSEGSATTLARSDHSHALRTTTGPTDLAVGAIADGEFLKRVGSTIVGAAVTVADGSITYAKLTELISIQNATYTLAGFAANTPYNIFAPGQDTFTVAANTTYQIDARFFLTCSGTAFQLGILFGGTATYTDVQLQCIRHESATSPYTNNTYSAQILTITGAGVTYFDSASTNTYREVRLIGQIRINGAGTLVPQLQNSGGSNAASVVQKGSFFRMTPMGTDIMTKSGNVA